MSWRVLMSDDDVDRRVLRLFGAFLFLGVGNLDNVYNRLTD